MPYPNPLSKVPMLIRTVVQVLTDNWHTMTHRGKEPRYLFCFYLYGARSRYISAGCWSHFGEWLSVVCETELASDTYVRPCVVE